MHPPGTRADREAEGVVPVVRRRRGYRRALPVALLVSALVHALVLTLPLGRGPSGTGSAPAAGRRMQVAEHGIHVLDIRPVPNAEAPTPSEVTIPPASPDEIPLPSLATPAEAAPTAPRLSRDVGATLRPRLTDPRIWGRSPNRATGRAGTERRRLAERVDEITERTAGIKSLPAGDMSAWTKKDANGDRWGFSPGVIHLGGITVPLCSGNFDASNCGFGVAPAFRELYHRNLRTLIQLRIQGGRAALDTRARAIRARLDSLRDSIPADGR